VGEVLPKYKQLKDRKWFHEENLNETRLSELEAMHPREFLETRTHDGPAPALHN
jgi:hypothetical protein